MEIVAEARNLMREKFGISTATIQVIFLQTIIFYLFPFIYFKILYFFTNLLFFIFQVEPFDKSMEECAKCERLESWLILYNFCQVPKITLIFKLSVSQVQFNGFTRQKQIHFSIQIF